MKDKEIKILNAMSNKKIRHTVLYIKNLQSRNIQVLFSVFEALEPDMQDYDMVYDNKTVNVGEFSVLLIHSFLEENDIMNLSERPIAYIDGSETDLGSNAKYKAIHDGDHCIVTSVNQETNLTKVLPWREGPMYVRGYRDVDHHASSFLNDNTELSATVSSITSDELGFDLMQKEESLGVVYYVWHHEVIRNIHFQLSVLSGNIGVMCGVDYRRYQNLPLNFILQDVDKEENILQEGRCRVSNGETLFLIRFDNDINALTVRVLDDQDNLIFFEENMHFIRSISVETSIVDSETGEKGKMEVSVIGAKGDTHADKDMVDRRKNEYLTKIQKMLKSESPAMRMDVIKSLKEYYENSEDK